MKDTNYIAAAILFLTPAISVELLTGDTLISQYLEPITFVLLNVTYGGALLLIRETVVRWNKGFASVLVLASGYGMLNEAICTKGFFAPQFYAVVSDGLEGYGRYFGINVPWALSVSIIHAVLSTTVPFLIVSIIFPGTTRWIGDRLYTGLLIVLVAVCAFSFEFIALPPSYYYYSEGPGPIILILLLMALLIIVALKLPTVRLKKWRIHPHPALLFILGAAYVFSIWFIPGAVRLRDLPPGIYAAFLLAFFVIIPIWLVIKLPEPTARGKVALAAGFLFLWMTSSLLAGITSNATRLFPFAVVLALLGAAFRRAGQLTPPVAPGLEGGEAANERTAPSGRPNRNAGPQRR
jgi:hypothetical protein